jgi:peptidoglycan/LPS O-acetylase OafA/YrhL
LEENSFQYSFMNTFQRIHSLDGLRGYAAVLISVMHFQGLFANSQFLDFAYLAVDVFFVLSGFVIAFTYLSRIDMGMSFIAFLGARFARLWPIFFITTLLGFSHAKAIELARGVQPSGAPDSLVLGANFFFIPDLAAIGNQALFPFNGPSWSIMAEVLVNIVFFWLVRAGRRSLLLPIVVVVMAVGLAVTIEVGGNLDGGWGGGNLWVGILRCMFGFSVGVGFFVLYRAQKLGPLALVPAEVPAAILLLSPLMISDQQIVEAIAIFVLIPVMIGAALLKGGRILENPVAQWLGTISYSVYLWQAPLGLWFYSFSRQVLRINPSDHIPLAGLIWLVMLLSIAWVSYRFVETPSRDFIRQRLVQLPSG